MELKARCKYPRINDAPKEFDHKKWISNYLWGMAAAFIGAVLTTAALVAVGVLSVATCGVGGIIVAGFIGIIAGVGVVTSVAINDIQHGEVSSWGKYFFGGLICGAIGSALAGLGVYLDTVGAGIAEAKLAIYRQSALKIFDTGLAGMFQKGMFALTIDLPVSTIASSIFTGPPDPNALTVDMLLCFIFPNLPSGKSCTSKAVSDIFWTIVQDLYSRDWDEDGDDFEAPDKVIGEYMAN